MAYSPLMTIVSCVSFNDLSIQTISSFQLDRFGFLRRLLFRIMTVASKLLYKATSKVNKFSAKIKKREKKNIYGLSLSSWKSNISHIVLATLLSTSYIRWFMKEKREIWNQPLHLVTFLFAADFQT